MYLIGYGTTFNLIQNGQLLSEDEAKTAISQAFNQLKIQGQSVGASFDGNHLVPSVNFMSQTHQKCELTAIIQKADIEVKGVSTAKAALRKKIEKLRETTGEVSDDQQAIEYIKACGTVKIEGVGARVTNRGDGFTLYVNSGDTQEAREMVERFTTIRNQDSRNQRATDRLVLTMFDEVSDVMIAIGLGQEFLAKADTIAEGEIWQRELSEL